MIKAIIFDCFGVVLADVLREQRMRIGRDDPKKAQELADIVNASNRGFSTREEAAEQMAAVMGVRAQDILATADAGEVKNEPLIAFIRTLRPAYKVAMLSNVRSRERLDQRFGPGGLDELFDVVIASGDVGYVKPERQIYELAASQLGVQPEECIMLDDVDTYCTGAVQAGMQAIQFTDTDQAIRDLRQALDS